MSVNPLPYETLGNPDSKQLVVLLHGWPDTAELWSMVIPELQNDSYLLNVSYPNFSDKETKKWGEDFHGAVQRLKTTIDKVNTANRKVVLCIHDWGSVVGYMLDAKYPGFVSEIISFDVSPKLNWSRGFIAYQLIVLFAFLIGGAYGDKLVRKVLAPLKFYNPPYKSRINASMGYFYYYFWKAIVKARFNLANVRLIPGVTLSGYKPSCPVAYAYSTKKRFHFHNDLWLKEMQKEPNQLIALDNSSHWIPLEQPKFVAELVKKKIARINT